MRYVTATAIFAVALLLRLLALPLEQRAGFITFYPAMVLVFYLCGIGPGLWLVLLSAVSGFFLFYPPHMTWVVTPTSGLTALSFLASSLIIGLVMNHMHRLNRQLSGALAQAALNDARWRAMIDDQSDIVVRFDSAGAVLFSNPVAQRLFGGAARAGVPGSWQGVVHPDDLPAVRAQIDGLSREHPQARFDCRVLDTAGRVHWVDFIDHALHDAEGRLLEIQSVGRDVSERKALEAHLQQAEAQLRDFYDNAPIGYYSLDAQGRFLRLNRVVEQLLETPADELLGRLGPGDFACGGSREEFGHNLRLLIDEDRTSNYVLDLRSARGNARRVRVRASALRDAQGAFLYTRSVMIDITELHQARQALEQVAREQHAMLHTDLVGMLKVRKREVIWSNPAFDALFGYAPGELLGQSSRLLYADAESYLSLGRDAYTVLQARGTYRTQTRMVRKSGEALWVDLGGVMLDAAQDESLWMMLDITERKTRELRIEHLAFHDALTGLPNRALLRQLLEHEMAASQRAGHRLALVFLDLDGFKPINDTHGHEAGDEVLRIISARLKQAVRGHDIVARLGGDEFVVVLTQLTNEAPLDLLQRLHQQLREPIQLEGGGVARVSASLGVALYPDDASDAGLLLRHADAAMYAAKGAGRDQIRLYREVA